MKDITKLLHLHVTDLWLILRSAVLYALSLVAVRLLGKRTIGQLSPFDLLAIVILGAAVAIPMEDEKLPFTHGLIPIVMVTLISWLISKVILRSRRIENILQGKPTVLIENGEVVVKNIKQERISMTDLAILLREKDINNIQDVQEAILEPNGQLSVILKPEYQPLRPKDIGITTAQGMYPTVLVSGGEIVYDNLDKVRLGLPQLMRELAEQGIRRVQDVNTATLDETGQLTVRQNKEEGADGKREEPKSEGSET
ncbi:MAG: YetF domain-containing protein [bacterium]